MTGGNHLVIGAGPIGRELVHQLTERGDQVLVATRSGTRLPLAEAVTADASDAAALIGAAEGADTIFLCSNPAVYAADEWQRVWPPIFRAAIQAARSSGAGLVVMGNLYPYGKPEGPMTECSPEMTTEAKGVVRREGWAAVKAAHDAGEIRAVEVRASDYFGPGAGGTAHLGERFFGPIMASKTAYVVGDPAMPHSWSYLPDIAATLVAAADHTGPWGRVWHVPSGLPHSRHEIADTLNDWFDAHGKAAGVPQWLLAGLGLFSPQWRGVYESSYQFTAPFVLEATETERMLGVQATPWPAALRETAQSYRPLS
ncbi:NAD-dependent epimerase/dehydratase family protein [Gryllotalpicola ginsengisoli]|uniref:NAD-dependent epimerase/dehydratase family protein n=1 Tax=Gryllotalpicola ginsengisoli TaxID=444608 RepID=UPI0003B39E39|nr:NAD-dependent epimerase/dehydratase family protein [Gryllotalpicola ginsengisoli]